MDKYFWVQGKIQEGNLSLILPNKNMYKDDFLQKLNLTKQENNQKSNKFDKIIAKKLISDKKLFINTKLEQIQKFAREIQNPLDIFD